jgi:hypothetical protein
MHIVVFCSIFLYLLINKSFIVLFVMHVNLDVMYVCLFLLPPLEPLVILS